MGRACKSYRESDLICSAERLDIAGTWAVSRAESWSSESFEILSDDAASRLALGRCSDEVDIIPVGDGKKKEPLWRKPGLYGSIRV